MKMVFTLFIVLVFLSCDKSETQHVETGKVEGSQWKDVSPDPRVISQHGGLIVFEREGHEYLFNTNGGIAHSESCPCKVNDENKQAKR